MGYDIQSFFKNSSKFVCYLDGSNIAKVENILNVGEGTSILLFTRIHWEINYFLNKFEYFGADGANFSSFSKLSLR